MKNEKLSITQYKVLHTVKSLNDMNLYANQEGIYKILSGVDDEDTKDLKSLPTYSTLTSYSSKKICHLILTLLRRDYIKKIYDPKTDDFYLKINESGITLLDSYLKKHNKPYSKTEKVFKKTIIKLS